MMSLVPSMWQNTPHPVPSCAPHHRPHTATLGSPASLPLPLEPRGGAVTSRAPHGLPLTLTAGLCSLIQRCSFLFLRRFSKGWKNRCAQQSGSGEGTRAAGRRRPRAGESGPRVALPISQDKLRGGGAWSAQGSPVLLFFSYFVLIQMLFMFIVEKENR